MTVFKFCSYFIIFHQPLSLEKSHQGPWSSLDKMFWARGITSHLFPFTPVPKTHVNKRLEQRFHATKVSSPTGSKSPKLNAKFPTLSLAKRKEENLHNMCKEKFKRTQADNFHPTWKHTDGKAGLQNFIIWVKLWNNRKRSQRSLALFQL